MSTCSAEIAKNHPGGSIDEILTVYTMVNGADRESAEHHAVQILIDGHEVDTLAGHVDLRRPLARTSEWIEQPKPAAAGRKLTRCEQTTDSPTSCARSS